MAARHHFEQPLLTGEQSFSPLPVVDVRLQYVPAGDTTLGVSKRKQLRQVFGVDRSLPPRSISFVNAKAGVFAPLLIKKSTCPSGSAVHTNPGSASTTRRSSFSIPGSFRDIRRDAKVRQSRANVYHTLVLVCGEAEAIALRENNGALDVGGYVARALIVLKSIPVVAHHMLC
jgi:hypothetical protein